MRSVFDRLKLRDLTIALIINSFLFLCFSSFSLAQYTADYTDLLQTTFTRQFDKEIIFNYLHSSDQRKINAALLSISNSQDTLFVSDVISAAAEDIDLKIFCLESLGACYQSSEFFRKNIESHPDDASKYFIGLSKTGSQNDLEKIIENSSDFGNELPLSIVLLNFSQRGMTVQNQNDLIYSELNDPKLTKAELTHSIYALSRLQVNANIIEKISELINAQLDQIVDRDLLQFALLAFRKNKFFPDDSASFNYFINSQNNLIRSLAASTVCFKSNFSSSDLRKYFSLIYDSNGPTARQTAISLQFLKIENQLSEELEQNMLAALKDSKVIPNVRGELLNSYAVLFSDKFADNQLDKIKSIPTKFVIRSLANFNYSKKYLDELIQYFHNGDELIKIESLNSLLSFLERDSFRVSISEILMSALNSDSPALISISADAIDSVYLSQNYKILEEILRRQINSKMDDNNFTESLMSLINLSEKFNPEFHSEVLRSLMNSAIYSIRKIVNKKLNDETPIFKDDSNFQDLIKDSFRYEAAEVTTNKGSFIIKFMPDRAPVSCGNFIKLVKENFYDGIVFHRVVPGFVIQAGDKSATGWQSAGYEIISEFSNRPFITGAVGMASSGRDTEGSQFFVMLGNYHHLDGKYTNFGDVVRGVEVVNQIDEGDMIVDIKLLEHLEF